MGRKFFLILSALLATGTVQSMKPLTAQEKQWLEAFQQGNKAQMRENVGDIGGQGGLIKIADAQKRTALWWVTKKYISGDRDYEFVLANLLEKEANPNAADQFGITPLMNAVQTGDIELVRTLLRAPKPSIVDMKGNLGESALKYAVTADKPDIASLLISQGAIATDDLIALAKTDNMRNLLQDAKRKRPSEAKAEQLFDALFLGQMDNINALLSQADLNAGYVNNRGENLLFAFAQSDYPYTEQQEEEITQALLKHGVRGEAATAGGYTPLILAAREAHPGIVKTLIDSGVNVNLRIGGKPIDEFLIDIHDKESNNQKRRAYEKIINMILPKLNKPQMLFPSAPPMPGPEFFDANKNAADLIVAIAKADTATIRELLKKPFNPNFVDPETEYTPLLTVARSEEDLTPKDAKEFALAIIAAGADKDGIVAGFTPLAVAAKSGNLGVVEALIALGADLTKQVKGQTALAMAREEEKVQTGQKKIAFQRIINGLENAQGIKLTNFDIAPTPTPSPMPGPVGGMQPLVSSMQKLLDQLNQLTVILTK
ncbi:MAG: Ankyrin repeats (3 copies) [Candidatus Dependentiae bacterium ADurb.Bin331]|nr:MAG: Ankyrin repeats (3 copies) [Candidatus Dependentiae bacterium ADurb.Bin331]